MEREKGHERPHRRDATQTQRSSQHHPSARTFDAPWSIPLRSRCTLHAAWMLVCRREARAPDTFSSGAIGTASYLVGSVFGTLLRNAAFAEALEVSTAASTSSSHTLLRVSSPLKTGLACCSEERPHRTHEGHLRQWRPHRGSQTPRCFRLLDDGHHGCNTVR